MPFAAEAGTGASTGDQGLANLCAELLSQSYNGSAWRDLLERSSCAVAAEPRTIIIALPAGEIRIGGTLELTESLLIPSVSLEIRGHRSGSILSGADDVHVDAQGADGDTVRLTQPNFSAGSFFGSRAAQLSRDVPPLLIERCGQRIENTSVPARQLLPYCSTLTDPQSACAASLGGGTTAFHSATRLTLLHGYFTHEWLDERRPLAEVLYQRPSWSDDIWHGAIIENFRLDPLPADRFIVDDVGPEALSLKFAHAISCNTLTFARAGPILAIRDASNIRVTNVNFAMSAAEAISVLRSNHISFDGVTVRRAQIGINIKQSRNVSLEGSSINDISFSCIQVAGGDRQSLASANIVISGNEVSRCGTYAWTYSPAIDMNGVGIIVRQNYLHTLRSGAIQFLGNDHTIEQNRIGRVGQGTGDVGAIYTGRDWTSQGSIIRNNIIFNSPGANRRGAAGIYLDDQASGIKVIGNVIVASRQGVLIGGGRDNRIVGNLIVDTSDPVELDARGMTWQRAMTLDPHGVLQVRFRSVPVSTEPYRSRYPHLANVLTDRIGEPLRNEFDENVVVGGNWPPIPDQIARNQFLGRNVSVPEDEIARVMPSLRRYLTERPASTFKPNECELILPNVICTIPLDAIGRSGETR